MTNDQGTDNKGTKCPRCGETIKKDAWLCLSCSAHICFLCRNFCLYEDDPQYECKTKGCELEGKRVCAKHIFIPRPTLGSVKKSILFSIFVGLSFYINSNFGIGFLSFLVSFSALYYYFDKVGLKEGKSPCCIKCKRPYQPD